MYHTIKWHEADVCQSHDDVKRVPCSGHIPTKTGVVLKDQDNSYLGVMHFQGSLMTLKGLEGSRITFCKCHDHIYKMRYRAHIYVIPQLLNH